VKADDFECDFGEGGGLVGSMETWRRFRALPVPERKLVWEAARRLTATWIGLRVRGFVRERERAEVVGRAAGVNDVAHGGELAAAREIARAEGSAARHLFFRANCLVQSLALLAMCRSRGIAAELRIGARNEGGAFQAHAWIELNGEALNDSGANGEHEHFVPFGEAVPAAEPGAAGTRRP
jgi:hypothetical protein